MRFILNQEAVDFRARTPGCTALYSDIRKLLHSVGHLRTDIHRIWHSPVSKDGQVTRNSQRSVVSDRK